MIRENIPESSISEQHDDQMINQKEMSNKMKHHAVLRWNFLDISLTHLWAIGLQIPEMLLILHDSLLYIKRLSCLRERTIRFRITLSSAFFSKVLSWTVLISASGFVITSHQGLNHFDYVIRVCPYHIKQHHISIRFSKVKNIFREIHWIISYVALTLKSSSCVCVFFLNLG